jgi:cytochrome c biogenesis protein CcmG/thiol:disulfide interchange protein DsbE
MSEQKPPEEPGSRKHERTGTWRGRAAFVIPGLVLVGLLAWGFLAPSGPRTHKAPEFELDLLGGGTLSSDDLKGHPVVLNFWASWCDPCREEMPAFERMWRRYRSAGIRIVGVVYQDSVEGAEGFLDEVPVSYPIALDPSGSLASELGVRGLPQTFFIDDDFRFERVTAVEALEGGSDRVAFGALDEDALEEEILQLLED